MALKPKTNKKNKKEKRKMDKYVCTVCGWVYDEEQGLPENGIAAGTKFEDLPDDFACELCGVGKDSFEKE
jgi:rubredoxin-NAD+ reductase